MPKYQDDCACNYNVANGNSLDLEVNFCESEIRADIIVSEYSGVRLWGRVINCEGEPVPAALVKLLKVEYHGCEVSYKGVAHTVSDCDGFYQFEVCPCEDKRKECYYKVLVSKAAYGPEKVIPTRELNCDVCCEKPCDNPCDDHHHHHHHEEPCEDFCEDPCEECEYYGSRETQYEPFREYPPIVTPPGVKEYERGYNPYKQRNNPVK